MLQISVADMSQSLNLVGFGVKKRLIPLNLQVLANLFGSVTINN